ncbi:BREX-1 system adenine-specific DNA-methyltransferase PglX [Cyanobium sp. BA20m-p-22]|uniref:BREX-1 system adenine-specific DNA-methyltransferase PglX n=1 Tax=Cyanobium sp. BA20m-p-22 TaxID=2823704 RepID=UPI0020CE5A18|nr:BREX-1 system adenine-specific DNA-methyltransferase PglX [Cyanobium sp. BA20m-p-22]MCP9910194.1 BREX-1 system adenine-specific DNA-methyltransferase PglX [Cyanobium sp. BA20m-p-22]
MPVNTAALKTFAPAMRRQLIEAVGRKLDLLLTSQTPDTLGTHAQQITELREHVAQNHEQLLERVAYSWFNRLAALRYLDARGWHPFGARVLMPQTESETQPEVLKLLRSGSLPAELQPHTDEARLQGLLDGRLPTAQADADPQGEVYRELILAVCRSYHQLLPKLFEGLDDASELLLPDDLLSDGSIAGGFRSQISDSDCEDVEIIGWLYQFYISEKKDQVIGKVVKSEDIPAATQLFTPNWIVKYMVQNSLGAQWLETYPDSALKDQMEYYIEPAEQTDEVKAQLAAITPESLNPEDLTLIDPACGSGHILVEAYELFKAIYLERGYQQREIPQLILEKNLFGLDIDERAAQLTSFALMMKGRGDDRRLFERGIQLNVMALVNSDGLDVEALAHAINLADHGLKLADLVELKQLFEHASTFGSLIQVPDGLAFKLPALRRLSELRGQEMIVAEELKSLEPLVRQAELLAVQYDDVVANPPYMGGKVMNGQLKGLLKDHFKDFEKDVFSAFIARNLALTRRNGHLAFMSPFVWMFVSAYQPLRARLVEEETITSLVQLEYSGFDGATVPICTFALRKGHLSRERASFVKLSDFKGADNQGPRTLEAIRNRHCGWFFEAAQDDFKKIPGTPVAYWVGERLRNVFERSTSLSKLVDAKEGLGTRDDDQFLRFWFEVSQSRIGMGCSDRSDAEESGKKWFPCNKGGPFRKWAGNQEHVVNWQRDGDEIKSFRDESGRQKSRPQNQAYYFRSSVSWSGITSGPTSFRKYGEGFINNDASMSAFATGKLDLWALAAYCNTPIASVISRLINPALNFKTGDFLKIPFLEDIGQVKLTTAGHNAASLVGMSSSDWNSFERSWDFQFLPLLSVSTDPNPTLESSYTACIANNKQIIAEMKRLEEENNRLFIDAYGLQDELNPEVPIEQITLTVNPAYRYGGDLNEEEKWERFRRDTMAEFLSYATGCMMGRYSLDQPGLILADSRESQAAQLTAYEEKVGKHLGEVQFKPDPDGIIPVLDGEWFEDDIVARIREFLTVTFPESSVGENLRFIEESLGKDIRKYFCSEFYKDHLQAYKKRPIYWLVQSPKKGFSFLIYLHRYTKDTLNQVLNNYFRPYLQKLEARLAQLGLDQLNDDLPTRERTAARKEAEKITKVLKECQAWEQDALLPLAQQRIELDLDDGVKVNYLKLQEVLAPIPGLAAKED